MAGITLLIALINLICVFIIFVIIIYMYGKIIDTEINVSNLFEYRKYNEIQLQNLIKDVNTNDTYLSKKIDA